MHTESLGPYVLGELLGKGGMGSVYRAEHRETGETVAVKALSPHLAASDGFRERFEGEIESLQTLRHNGIVRLLGHGEEAGTLYYAMELVDGPSLEEELRSGRRFGWRETTQIAIQVSRALKHAHDHGVIHRDIKPANLLLTENGEAKIADFGIARVFGSTGVTMAGGVLGTADYMAPEQAAGKPVTARCDQYSLGGVMYALLAGRPPFRAADLAAMLQLQRFAIAEPVERFAPDTPKELSRIVGQLLEKDPTRRFPNTLVLARRLEAMSRALARPASDDFELYEGGAKANASDERTDAYGEGPDGEAGLAVTCDAPLHVPGDESVTPASPGADPPADNSETLAAGMSRYTPVTEQPEEPASHWRPVAGLAALFVAAASLLAMGVWWSTRPLDADQLYTRLAERHEAGDVGASAGRAIEQFLDRFPNDDRAVEVAGWGQAIEQERRERRMRLLLLAGRRSRDAVEAEEILYGRAKALGQTDPLAGAEALDRLADLLVGFDSAEENGAEANGALKNGEASTERREALASLAKNEAADLRELADRQQQTIADFARQRLADARAALDASPNEARLVAEGVLAIAGSLPADSPLIPEAEALINDAKNATTTAPSTPGVAGAGVADGAAVR